MLLDFSHQPTMKNFRSLILALSSALLFTSCLGLPSSPPSSVTDPKVLATFNKAKKGDGDALYAISCMYKNGTNGFPKSSMRSSDLLMLASQAKPPSGAAFFDLYRDKLEQYEMFGQSSDKRMAYDYLEKAIKYGDSRAIEMDKIARANIAKEEEEERRSAAIRAEQDRIFWANHDECSNCNGKGGWEKDDPNDAGIDIITKQDNYVHKSYQVTVHRPRRKIWVECKHCKGNGYLPKY